MRRMRPSTATAPLTVATTVRDLQDQVRELRTSGRSRCAPKMPSPVLRCASCARTCNPPVHFCSNGLQCPPAVEPRMVPAQTSPPAEVESRVIRRTHGASAGTQLEERVQKLEESTSLIGSKIDEQYQTKVETASKYRARLHGIVLMNAFRNVGRLRRFGFPQLFRVRPPGLARRESGSYAAPVGNRL